MEEKKKPEDAKASAAKDEKKDAAKAEREHKKELDAAKAALADTMKKLAEAEAKFKESDDRYLHMLAEYDNFRRRSAKERDDVYNDAVSDVIGKILPVLDNLERASLYTDAEKVAEGLALTSKSAQALLESLSVKPFGEAGDAFDPNLHNAVMHVEDASLGENVITDVFQKGYAIGDRVIRYAMVKVAN